MDNRTIDNLINIVDLKKPARLILGYRSVNGKVSLSRVAAAQDAQRMFAEIANQILEDGRQRVPEEWEPARPVSKETYLVTTCKSVGNVPQVAKSKTQPLLKALIETQSIAETNGNTLRKASPYFYAFQFGTGKGSVTFLRKLNPQRGLRKKWLGFLGDELSLSNHEVFAFDSYADLIIMEADLFIFSQTAFASIFRGQTELSKMTEGWVDEINKTTQMTEDSHSLLLQRGLSDSRISRRIESIVRRGHLLNLSSSDLREGMLKCDLDPSEHMNEANEILLTDGTLFDVLKFLNEDMFLGLLTNDPFEVDSKTRRT